MTAAAAGTAVTTAATMLTTSTTLTSATTTGMRAAATTTTTGPGHAMTSKASRGLILAADQRQPNDRDQKRDPKQHYAIHPRTSKKK
jgi:hypothetical protein